MTDGVWGCMGECSDGEYDGEDSAMVAMECPRQPFNFCICICAKPCVPPGLGVIPAKKLEEGGVETAGLAGM
jgi:hypothetical protein